MTTILIADGSKPSLVMTSEIFKDKIPGVLVYVAENGKEALEKVAEISPDMCVVDFDLPDVDGPALIEGLRRHFSGPILMTAYPDDVVYTAVRENLFTCTDASSWIPKPVKEENLCGVIDKFLDGHRLNRRFCADIETQLVGKAAGRGKRAPKVSGMIRNISIGGAFVELSGSMKMKKSQELTMSLSFPSVKVENTSIAGKAKKATKTTAKKATASKGTDAKIKAKVVWHSTSKGVGLEFFKLSDVQKKSLLAYLKNSFEAGLVEG